jgi:hypothetical protein
LDELAEPAVLVASRVLAELVERAALSEPAALVESAYYRLFVF